MRKVANLNNFEQESTIITKNERICAITLDFMVTNYRNHCLSNYKML